MKTDKTVQVLVETSGILIALLLDLSPSRKGMRPFHYSIMLWHVLLLPDCFFNVMQRAK